MKKFFLAFLAVVAVGCTTNSQVKYYGGTGTLTLPPGEKLVTATWKEASLWYLTRPMRPGEEPETLHFREDSAFGLVQGTVIIKETR